jgi:hypothetical protein
MNTKTNPFQSQFAFTGNYPSAKKQNKCLLHSAWLEDKTTQNYCSFNYSLPGNPAQHKNTLKLAGVVGLWPMCWAVKKIDYTQCHLMPLPISSCCFN